MIIIDKSLDEPFSILPQSTLRDKRISFKAQGLLTYLLSLPHNWQVNYRHLAAERESDGDTSIRSAMRELLDAGYAEQVSRRSEDGRFISDWIIRSRPVLKTNTGVEKPHRENHTGKSHTKKEDTEEVSKEEVSIQSISSSSKREWIKHALILHPEYIVPLDERTKKKNPDRIEDYQETVLKDWIDRQWVPPVLEKKKTEEEEYMAFKERIEREPVTAAPKKEPRKIVIHPDDAGGVAWLKTEEGKRRGILGKR